MFSDAVDKIVLPVNAVNERMSRQNGVPRLVMAVVLKLDEEHSAKNTLIAARASAAVLPGGFLDRSALLRSPGSLGCYRSKTIEK